MKRIYLLTLLLLSTYVYSQTLFDNHYLNNNNQKRENLPLKNVLVNHYEKYIVLGHQADRNATPTDFAKTILTFINGNGGVASTFQFAVNDTLDLNGQCFVASGNQDYIIAGSVGIGSSKRAMAFRVNTNGNVLWANYYDGIEFRQIEYSNNDLTGNRYYIMTGIYKDTSNLNRVMAIKINQNGTQTWGYYYYPQNTPWISSEEPKSLLIDRTNYIAGTRNISNQDDLFVLQINTNGNVTSQLLNYDYGLDEWDPFLIKYPNGFVLSFTASDTLDTLYYDKHAIAKLKSNWNPYWTRYYADTLRQDHYANAIHQYNTSLHFATAGTTLRNDSITEPYYFSVDSNGTILNQANYPDTFPKSTSYFTRVDTGFVLHALDLDSPLSHKFNLLTFGISGNTICNENPDFYSKLKYPEIGIVDFIKDSLEKPDTLFLIESSPYTPVFDCNNDSVHRISAPFIIAEEINFVRAEESRITLSLASENNTKLKFEIINLLGQHLEEYTVSLSSGYNEIQLPVERKQQIIFIRAYSSDFTKTFKILH